MKIKAPMKYHFRSIKMAIVKRQHQVLTRMLEPSYIVGGIVEWCSHFGKTVWQSYYMTQ